MNEGINEAANRPDDQSPNRTVRLEGPPPAPLVDERHIQDLVSALGNPKHRAHRTSVDELVAIGPAAVPTLAAALGPDRPWLTSYRAAEALAQIGDGRATGALINALRHPNSNVRWSVVQALSEIGDSRSIMALRRVAREDRGKTSWGEAVSDTAQLALDRLQSRSIFLRFWDPLKTILVAGIMVLALAFAMNSINDLRERVRTPASLPAEVTDADMTATAQAADEQLAAATPSPEATPSPQATAPPAGVTGRVNTNSNFRSAPNRDRNSIIQVVREGTEVQVLGRSESWFRVRVENGREGWIAANQVDVPRGADIPEAQP
jgi:hypothetical protein